MSGVLKCLIVWGCLAGWSWAYEMDEVTRARMERYLPRSLAKLEKREPVHLLVVGDGTAAGFHYGKTRNQLLHAFPGVFARELAKEFFYTGGVRDLAPEAGAPEKLDESLGPEITIERRAVEEADVFYGFAALTTDGFDRDPDVVLLNFGAMAARNCLLPRDFEVALSGLIGIAKKRGSDVIVVGPTPAPDGSNGMESVAATRVIAGLAGSVARRHGVFFGDAGRLLVEALPRVEVEGTRGLGERFLAALEGYFDHGPDISDKRYLNAAAHALLGERMLVALRGGSGVAEVELSGTASATKEGFEVSLDVVNPSGEALEMELMPLAIGAATRPVLEGAAAAHEVEVDLAGNARGVLRWNYAEGSKGGWLPWMRCDSVKGTGRVLRLPVLAAGESGYSMVDVEATLVPLAVVWDFGTQINVGDRWAFGAAVHCQGDERWRGRYVVKVGEERAEGELSVAAGEMARIDVELGIPDGGRRRFKEDVVLELTRDGGEATVVTHEVEFSQNIGMGDWVKLAAKERYVSGTTGDPEVGDGAVMMRAAADGDALYMEFDLRGLDLVGAAKGAAVIVDLAIDGRYYKERGKPGFVGPLVVSSGVEDGDASVYLMELGVFGNGYDRRLVAGNVRAKLSTQGDGTRRISVVVPRAYFYLHEWALDNGNSQLGVNATVSLLRVSEAYPDGYYPLGFQYCLVNPGMSRRDARALTVLELTEQPTKRWSVRLY